MVQIHPRIFGVPKIMMWSLFLYWLAIMGSFFIAYKAFIEHTVIGGIQWAET